MVCLIARALEVLEVLASCRPSHASQTAATMAATLQRLTSVLHSLTPATLNATFSIASLLVNRTLISDDAVAASIVASMSNAITAGALGAGR